jgi:PAS domain S-box-containing protein
MVFNEIWANQLGYTSKELAPYDLATRAQLTHPEDLERAEGILTRCLNGAVPAYECELRMQHKAGHWVWILDRGRVMTYDATGAPLLMFGTHQDITGRKTAERTLIEREEELEVAQRIAQLGSWRLDLETGQVKWSMELYTMYGMDPAMPPPPYTEHGRLFTPESWDTLSAALEHTRLTGIPYELELDTVRADGGRGYMWVRGEVVRDADGQVVGLQGVTQDISKRKAAEKALRDSEETHRALVASLPDIVKRFDREGRHLYVSGKVREITDIEASQFLGKTHRELGFPEAQCRFWETAIQQVFDHGLPYEAEFTIEGKRGPMVHYFRLVPEQDADGAVHSVLALRRDITQQRRAEQDYKTLFREMLEGFAVHEIICDDAGRPVDYRFLAVNPGFERLTGLRSEEVLGRTVLAVLPDTEPFWIEIYGQVALTGEPAFIEHRSNALGKFFEVRAFRPGPNQFACIFEDVSERKHLEDQLRQAQKMEAVGRLAGGVAHDFNNILQIILVNTEFLQEEHEIGTQARRLTDEVKAAAEHAADLTRQLLTFSRRQVTQPVPLDLNALLQSITKMIRRLIGEHIVLSADISPDLDVVLADKGQVEQVLINLCVNARDAMPEGGTINIEAMNIWIDADFCRHHPGAEEGRHVLLSVSDTGHGMDQETCAHIFEPFFTTKGVGEGTGLGLATVYGVVKQNKGFIQVYSEPGIGTVFRVYLPAVEQTKGLPIAVDTTTGTTGTETILVAEDDPIVLDLVVRMLCSAGYTVLSATDGIEAVRVFEEHAGAIQLVILDVIMPGMGGRQVMDRILESHAGMRILFSSGYSETGIHKDFVLHDGIQLIQKPYSKGDLLRAVRQALDATP